MEVPLRSAPSKGFQGVSQPGKSNNEPNSGVFGEVYAVEYAVNEGRAVTDGRAHREWTSTLSVAGRLRRSEQLVDPG